RLLELTNAGAFGAQLAEQSLAQIKLSLAQAPAGAANKVLGEFESELRKEFAAEKMIAAIIPIYDKHLTNQDIVNLTAFYQTPTGRKFVAALPQITREVLEDGVRRGREVSQRVLTKLQAEGVINIVPSPAPTAKKQRPRRAT
ncbi:MAG: DUF2059 domain-containing protein, partial [Acidobacteria bacterium]|nr:DUF2059 domain-containing protein [Acidobacteriota bacterium]